MTKNIKDKEDEKPKKSNKETVNLMDVAQKSMAGTLHEAGESSKQAMNEERNTQLHIDLEKPNKDSTNRSLHQALKHQQLSAKSTRDETHSEKSGNLLSRISILSTPKFQLILGSNLKFLIFRSQLNQVLCQCQCLWLTGLQWGKLKKTSTFSYSSSSSSLFLLIERTNVNHMWICRYVAPLQGVISMDGNTMPSAPIQVLLI